MKNCIEWEKSRTRSGYGKRWWQGKVCRAHRVAYVEEKGIDLKDIDGLVVRHKCDNPACINPNHLELGTQKDNLRDMAERGRSTRGEAGHFAKLTADQVEDIRSRYAFRCSVNGGRVLAAEYSVSEATISMLVRGITWQ